MERSFDPCRRVAGQPRDPVPHCAWEGWFSAATWGRWQRGEGRGLHQALAPAPRPSWLGRTRHGRETWSWGPPPGVGRAAGWHLLDSQADLGALLLLVSEPGNLRDLSQSRMVSEPPSVDWG